ncbi:MAG: UDP-N-acetylmuramate dehydrogenase [Nitrospirae bacterium]|nr:UDP-N-acetylmuramate dehydrogenase [Nitrospirota bacterium]MBF0535323.1 UDP-N-acetylmuramate dehydrogenase [Nitrospirota bacterium]MBF0617254.1 UDP-N-acetylmuramate dehydrogenase [Nitrospirota bacterium]
MQLNVLENYPLSELTTFKIGGAARFYVKAESLISVFESIEFAKLNSIPFYVLGGGSNLLVSDKGYGGVVIHMSNTDSETISDGESVYKTCGAGVLWDNFVSECVSENLFGVECLSGIPGTVGASPVQNIGAYGQSVDNLISEVIALDANTGEVVKFNNAECKFSYRKSLFNSEGFGRYIIISVKYILKRVGKPNVKYHDLEKYFLKDIDITLKEVRTAILKIREYKGMLQMEGYRGFKCAGSFFKNPVVSAGHFDEILDGLNGAKSDRNWYWPQADSEVKISAACLIENCFGKGYRAGRVGLSPNHTLAIVNYDSATFTEVMDFAKLIEDTVYERFKVTLDREVQIL